METEPLPRESKITEIRPHAAPTLKKRLNKIPKNKQRLIVVATIIAIVGIGRFAYTFFTTESTDDSFVSAHVHAIGSRVIGTVEKVVVEENQVVKKCDVLVKIDKRDFITAVKIGEAEFIKAKKDVKLWGG